MKELLLLFNFHIKSCTLHHKLTMWAHIMQSMCNFYLLSISIYYVPIWLCISDISYVFESVPIYLYCYVPFHHISISYITMYIHFLCTSFLFGLINPPSKTLMYKHDPTVLYRSLYKWHMYFYLLCICMYSYVYWLSIICKLLYFCTCDIHTF